MRVAEKKYERWSRLRENVSVRRVGEGSGRIEAGSNTRKRG